MHPDSINQAVQITCAFLSNAKVSLKEGYTEIYITQMLETVAKKLEELRNRPSAGNVANRS